MKNRNITFSTIILLAVGFFALSPSNTFGVVPAPDGGYPGFNTAAGQKALFSLTTGGENTAIGSFSLFSNTDGSFNTGVGAGTLLFNVGDPSNGYGVNNTAIGAAALLFNTTGYDNTAVGTQALFSNTEGASNTATGYRALVSNTTGSQNMATGQLALFGNTIGTENTASGYRALFSNMEGSRNAANGSRALESNSTGSGNTALGSQAMSATTSGSFNTAVGDSALSQNATGSGNTVLGYQAGIGIHTADNVIAIRASAEDVSNSCYIGQIFGATSAGGTAVFINGVGKLGTTTSSRRFKEDIKPMDKASEALFALKPVSFHYKKEIDPAGTAQFGLVAEEVEQVNPDLVVRDTQGKTYSVRYDQVNAMLLNEFLKEHRRVQEQDRKIEEQEAKIAQQEKVFQSKFGEQEKQIAALTSGLQKVSARIVASKPEPAIAANNY
jgi:trimeric autotransporter adhesin